ncbi:MAG TPA: hypothetical protein VMZ28_31160 [Kofleriaceae bacterium]|nr:hypothetical protein [Kofleriaceae bacterium]
MKSTVLAVLLAALATACGGDDAAEADASTAPDANVPRGTMSLSFEITQGGEPATCEDVNAQFVVLSFIDPDEGAGANATGNCSAGEIVSQEINPGTYNVDIDLVGPGAASLLDEPIEQDGVEVQANDDTALDPVTFEL